MYSSGSHYLSATSKRVALFGMSGLGKTHVSTMLRGDGGWFHYSIDYRIGTRYMGEQIVDNVKSEAMKVPFLRDLLMSNSIYIASNITFENLSPLSTYLGKPGKGALGIAEYRKRQAQHHVAERAALLDTGYFVDRAQALYGYNDFVADTGGSICEVVDPWDPKDPVLTALQDTTLLCWIEGSDDHTQALIARFDKSPKPMCYQEGFLTKAWDSYLTKHNCTEADVDPDSFIRWTYARALSHRQPRYAQMATWGVSVTADEIANVTSPDEFNSLIARAIDRSGAN